MLTLNNVSKNFGKFTAVENISLNMDNGLYALLAPNGAGKTTIIKMITTLLNPTEGEILYDGVNIKTMGAAYRELLGYLPQDFGYYKNNTPKQYLSYLAALKGVPKKETAEKIDYLLEMVGLSENADKKMRKFSGGMIQRVGIAQAMLNDPKILILDEPTSYLDMHYKLEILQSIRNMVKEENLAVVMSLHELDLAQKVSDLVACVDGETIAKIGRPEEIFCGDTIACLYGVSAQAYDVVSGSMFLQKAKGEPKVFVIGGGGSGIAAYYTLQRDQIPFAAGILSEGDVEYKAAKALASALVTTPAFYPIEIRQMAQARKWIDDCDYCICTLDAFGPLNQANKELLSYAKEQGKWIREGEKPWQK